MKMLLSQASRLLRLPAFAVVLGVAGLARAAAPLPPKPSTYVSDQAGLLDAATARSLRLELEQFERDTSNQLVVATFPRLPEGEALEDFTQRTAQSWKVGQADQNNGAVLFVFRDDRKMRIEVGYGLEGAIPDTVAARILANEVRPKFRANDYAGGIRAGMEGLMAAAKGEYSGMGTTVDERRRERSGDSFLIVLLVVMVLGVVLIAYLRSVMRDTVYNRNGRRHVLGPVIIDTHGPTWTGGGWGGGGGGSGWGGGGGGFSGGGGSFGGGGASGDW